MIARTIYNGKVMEVTSGAESLTGGKSGTAFRCKRWFLDARRGIQDLNGSRENKAYKRICIECLSNDMLRTNSDEVQKYGKLSIETRDEAPCRRSWKRLWILNSSLLLRIKTYLGYLWKGLLVILHRCRGVLRNEW
jgi:hypothetical protein